MLRTDFICNVCEQSIKEPKKALTITTAGGTRVAWAGCLKTGAHVCCYCAYKTHMHVEETDSFGTPNWLHCEIWGSGFDSERQFRIALDDGRVVGLANVQYLRGNDGQRLEKTGYEGPGYVKARVICTRGEGFLKIELPSIVVDHVREDMMVSLRD